ncbi:AzlC family ABC transporter permease [soil metagenome]
MTRATPRRAFLRGLRDGAPFAVVVIPFAMLFGLLAREAGWGMAEIMGMSALVIAGAAQFTALQMMAENAPLVLVIATSLAVNLRMAMYSASLAPHLGPAPLWQRALIAYGLVDQTYGLAINHYGRDPGAPIGHKVAYFAGAALAICTPWYGFTWLGAVAGQAIPEGLALDFAVPVTFIAIVAPALRSAPHLAAAVVAVAVALALHGLPFSIGLLAGAAAGMAAGAAAELAGKRR